MIWLLSWAYVVDIVGLDRNKIVGIGKWGTETISSGKGRGKGQRCDYVAGEAAIVEEGNGGKQGSRKQRRLKERAAAKAGEGFGCGCNCKRGCEGYGWQRRKEEGSDSRRQLAVAAGGGRRLEM
ncbi:hypothetical protein BHE74_00042505 [Ensete ventricosum]|nr:hypothetical protein BHE74_00042505 [Ensete ventricosum]